MAKQRTIKPQQWNRTNGTHSELQKQLAMQQAAFEARLQREYQRYEDEVARQMALLEQLDEAIETNKESGSWSERERKLKLLERARTEMELQRKQREADRYRQKMQREREAFNRKQEKRLQAVQSEIETERIELAKVRAKVKLELERELATHRHELEKMRLGAQLRRASQSMAMVQRRIEEFQQRLSQPDPIPITVAKKFLRTITDDIRHAIAPHLTAAERDETEQFRQWLLGFVEIEDGFIEHQSPLHRELYAFCNVLRRSEREGSE